jgi:hypothetical protein
LDYWKDADILHTLMTDVLGYRKYGSLGSDYGALVNSALGHKYGDAIIALHYGHDLPPGMFQHDRFWDLTAASRSRPTPRRSCARTSSSSTPPTPRTSPCTCWTHRRSRTA